MLLNKTEAIIWYRGEDYADRRLVTIVNENNNIIQAIVEGAMEYDISLKFTPANIRVSCNCPYYTQHGLICKHIVATTIVWDEKRGITRPVPEVVEGFTAPPDDFSRKDVDNLFSEPLEADLDILRILPEITALGGYVRPHSKLPTCPKITQDDNQPMTLIEIKKCFSEIRRWSRRKAFDPYFCSSEMIAAFCELLKIVKKRLSSTPLVIAAEILLNAQKFHYTLVMELIDTSLGIHAFSEAYLEDFCEHIKSLSIDENDKDKIEQFLSEFEINHGVY